MSAGRLARAAAIVALFGLISRLLGFAREIVLAAAYGATRPHRRVRQLAADRELGRGGAALHAGHAHHPDVPARARRPRHRQRVAARRGPGGVGRRPADRAVRHRARSGRRRRPPSSTSTRRARRPPRSSSGSWRPALALQGFSAIFTAMLQIHGRFAGPAAVGVAFNAGIILAVVVGQSHIGIRGRRVGRGARRDAAGAAAAAPVLAAAARGARAPRGGPPAARGGGAARPAGGGRVGAPADQLVHRQALRVDARARPRLRPELRQRPGPGAAGRDPPAPAHPALPPHRAPGLRGPRGGRPARVPARRRPAGADGDPADAAHGDLRRRDRPARVPARQVRASRASRRSTRRSSGTPSALWPAFGSLLLNRTLSAANKQRDILWTTVATVAITIILDLILLGPMEQAGLALAATIGVYANALMLLARMRRHFPALSRCARWRRARGGCWIAADRRRGRRPCCSNLRLPHRRPGLARDAAAADRQGRWSPSPSTSSRREPPGPRGAGGRRGPLRALVGRRRPRTGNLAAHAHLPRHRRRRLPRLAPLRPPPGRGPPRASAWTTSTPGRSRTSSTSATRRSCSSSTT